MNRLQIKQRFREKPHLTIQEFTREVKQLYGHDKRIIIRKSDIAELVRNKQVISNDRQLIPSFELIRIHPDEILNVDEFIAQSGISATELECAISRNEIEALPMDSKIMIRKNELRKYFKQKGLQMVYNTEDLYRLLDELFDENAIKWNDDTFATRERTADFVVDDPDENLVDYLENRKIPGGSVLELGCGHGRNAVYMAKHNCQVDAVDLAPAGITWAREYAAQQQVSVNFKVSSIYDLMNTEDTYDFIYDHGCFHHQTPHRRLSYVELVQKKLRKNGHLGIAFFNKVVSDHTDKDMYRHHSTKDGVPYNEQQISRIFGTSFDIVEFRQMEEHHHGKYGRDYLSTVLLRKKC